MAGKVLYTAQAHVEGGRADVSRHRRLRAMTSRWISFVPS